MPPRPVEGPSGQASELSWSKPAPRRSTCAGPWSSCERLAGRAGLKPGRPSVHVAGHGQRIHAQDIEINKAMGRFGAELIADGDTVMTHCNAGALATAGHGTALGVIRGAGEQGKKIQRDRQRNPALPSGRPAHGLRAAQGRHPGEGGLRQRLCASHAARHGAEGRGRARTASRPTATPPTRSAHSAWPSWPSISACRSTWPPRLAPST